VCDPGFDRERLCFLGLRDDRIGHAALGCDGQGSSSDKVAATMIGLLGASDVDHDEVSQVRWSAGATFVARGWGGSRRAQAILLARQRIKQLTIRER